MVKSSLANPTTPSIKERGEALLAPEQVLAGTAIVRVLSFALAVLAYDGVAWLAHGETLRVPEDFATVLAAVDAAATGDSVVVAPGVWHERQTRTISVNGFPLDVRASVFSKDGVTLVGTKGPEATVLLADAPQSGVRNSIVYRADQPAGEPFTIAGFTLRGGGHPLVMISGITGGNLRIEDTIIEGGGQAIALADDAELRRVTIRDHVAGAFQYVGLEAGPSVSLLMQECTVEGNDGDFLKWTGFGGNSITVRDCIFRDNSNGRLLDLVGVAGNPEVQIIGNRFEANDTQVERNGLCVNVVSCSGRIRRNVFVGNGHLGTGARSILRLSRVPEMGVPDVESNTFWASRVSGSSDGIVVLAPFGGYSFRRNICGASVGGPPVVGASSANGCNLFWDNDGDDFAAYPRQDTDIVADPQFCDPLAGDGAVAATSPCLASNNFTSCGDIGVVIEACPPTGMVPHLISTAPPGLSVRVDGNEHLAEVLQVWDAGSDHEIGCDAIQAEFGGTRLAFDSWSDGGGLVHEVTAGSKFVSYVASFLTEHFLDVLADSAGSTGPSEWVPNGQSRQVQATPVEGFGFDRWEGAGQGSYSGTDNPATVTMHGPITQVAYFHDLTPQLTMVSSGSGSVLPETASYDRYEEVEIEASPDAGYAFVEWQGSGSGSYTGSSNPAMVVMNEPITQTAIFGNAEYELTMITEGGGGVTPQSGQYVSFTNVQIEGIPGPGYRFVQWKGEGEGSYTGTDNPATVTLNGPITQVAHFEPAAFSATLSLSDSDPYVHTGGPVGLGDVHLWVTCGSTARGLQSIALKTAGSLHPLAFLPAPGVSATGTATILASIDGCPDGPVRLGRFLVNSPGEGSLCLNGRDVVAGLTITDCEGASYSWPENVGFVGVSTAGGQPCGGGSGCEEIDPFAVPVGAPEIESPPSATRLAGIFPNPFSGETTVHFDAARPMTVRVSVFDVAGRQIRTLEDRSVQAGRHAVQWDGRDVSGRAAAAGIYFVRLQGDGVDETGKVTLLRKRP